MKLWGNWSYPTEIRFGAGRLGELAEVVRAAGLNNPLFVTDRMLSELPITKAAIAALDGAGLGFGVFNGVDANPNEKNLSAGVEVFNKGRHDGVIAFGGGSALDLGKLIAFQAGQTRPVWDFEDIGDWWTRANSEAIVPIIAVPTTAGTGSEVGRAGVLTNSETRQKKIIFHPKILPVTVIADPDLTLDLPKPVTAGTGLDAFAHCLEAYCSPHYHPMSQGIALEGMRLLREWLPLTYTNGHDHEARAHVMSAAMMGAVAFQKGLGVIHAISHPVGAVYNTHHGMTNAVLLPYALDFNRKAIEDRIVWAADYLGIEGKFDGFRDFVSLMCAGLSVPRRLRDLGVKTEDIQMLAEMAIEDPSCGGNPIPPSVESITDLLERSV